MRFHEFFKILFLAGFCYLAQLCGGGSTRCGVAVALAIYYTTAVDHSRENSIVLNTAQHCSFVISLSLSLSPTCLGSLVCPMLFFCKHLSLVVDKQGQRTTKTAIKIFLVFGLFSTILTFKVIFLCQKSIINFDF